VTVLGVPSGRLVGKVGGKKLDNIAPSLSPDGTRVVFVRDDGDGSGRTEGIWTASADGSGLRQLVRKGRAPIWSPDGARIAYQQSNALRVVPAGGGGGTTLVRQDVEDVFGWSPDGRQIAFERRGGRLELVDAGSGKVRKLLQLRFAPSVVWSSSSRALLVKTASAALLAPLDRRVTVTR
jgi:Tol biopolymer transport system component